VARYGAKKTKQLLNDPGIVRNRLKIAAAIQNAKAFLAVQKSSGASTPTSGNSWEANRRKTNGAIRSS